MMVRPTILPLGEFDWYCIKDMGDAYFLIAASPLFKGYYALRSVPYSESKLCQFFSTKFVSILQTWDIDTERISSCGPLSESQYNMYVKGREEPPKREFLLSTLSEEENKVKVVQKDGEIGTVSVTASSAIRPCLFIDKEYYDKKYSHGDIISLSDIGHEAGEAEKDNENKPINESKPANDTDETSNGLTKETDVSEKDNTDKATKDSNELVENSKGVSDNKNTDKPIKDTETAPDVPEMNVGKTDTGDVSESASEYTAERICDRTDKVDAGQEDERVDEICANKTGTSKVAIESDKRTGGSGMRAEEKGKEKCLYTEDNETRADGLVQVYPFKDQFSDYSALLNPTDKHAKNLMKLYGATVSCFVGVVGKRDREEMNRDTVLERMKRGQERWSWKNK